MATETGSILMDNPIDMLPMTQEDFTSDQSENEDNQHNVNSVDRIMVQAEPGEATELIVLDPDHPLMTGFQKRLREMLLRKLNQSEVTMREKDEELKREKATHVEIGCELYNFQQELAKFQVQLEKKHAEYIAASEQSENAQKRLKELRENYQKSSKHLDEDTKSMRSMREEVDALCLRLFYLNNAKDEVMGDIKVMKRAAEKATIDLSNYEDEKLQQDLLVDRVQTKVDQLKEDIALYEAQITAQESEMMAHQSLLHEAEAQVVSIYVDRKHLMAQWNTSLLGLQRRNEAYAALTSAYNDLKDRLLVLENEGVAFKRSINSEQEKHEQLTVLVNKNEADLNTLKKQILQTQTKHEADKHTYSTYSRMLQETERNLSRAQAEHASILANVDALRKQMEKIALKKGDLETKLTTELRDRLTAKKSMEYVQKLNLHIQDQSRELFTQIARLENQIARDELCAAVKNAENDRLKERIGDVEVEIEERNVLINKLEAEINHATVMVERKQSAIDLLNKKLERVLHETGGQEIGPLEVMTNNLNKAVQSKQEEIGELEQQWLKEQNELVRHMNERDGLAKTVERLEKQLTILSQKKLRVDNEIAIQEREKAELERDLKHLQNDTIRLNAMIAKEKSTNETLTNENRLAETDFVRALREKEMEAAELQTKVENMKRDREDMLNELVDTERTIMLWEKKVQLCEETRNAVDCDLGQGEMGVMRHEIHRMQVRKSSLLHQQEKLLQALERSVQKRDMIVIQAEGQKANRNIAHIRINAQRQLEEQKKKLKATKQLAKNCTAEIQNLEHKFKQLEESISAKRVDFEIEQRKVDEISEKLQKLADDKQIYILKIQLKQHETVYWEQVREGRYRRLCHSSGATTSEAEVQQNRMRTLLSIMDRLEFEFPKIQRDLVPVRHLLNSRMKKDMNRTDSAAMETHKSTGSQRHSAASLESPHTSSRH